MDPATLIAVAKDTKAIANFVFGDGLNDTISMIVGDIHLEAAKLALKTATISKNKRDRINSAITHLEAAHIAYSKNLYEYNNPDESLYGAFKKDFGLRSVNIVFNISNIMLTDQKNVWVCCLIALCYASLDEPEAAMNILSVAERESNNWNVDSDFMARAATISLGIGGRIAALRGQKIDYSIEPLEVLWKFKSTLEHTLEEASRRAQLHEPQYGTVSAPIPLSIRERILRNLGLRRLLALLHW
jgi:hypothetical protein